ncbi:MAG TPA: serine/threonine-protein kinase, partial [Solirubrobacteraceae bacterium]
SRARNNGKVDQTGLTEELPTADTRLVLGRYRIGPRLGAGGFGAVYEAIDERLERPVAVKVIAADTSAPARAAREALAAARLDHPGIVAVYDAGEAPGERYLVSELVRGRTLAQLEAEDLLSDRDVVRIGLALADALAHAHERGVVHRDVKPQNVMVPDRGSADRSWRGVAKLTDFGVAHLVDDDALTRTGDVVGTIAYMAPEQAAGRRVDDRTDLYSLGLVLYEALAGVNPVRGANPAATARKVGTPLPSLARRRKDLPPQLAQAIDRAVRPRPNERGTVDDLADALADALTDDLADDRGAIARHPLEGPARYPAAPPALQRALAGLAAGALAAAALHALVPPRAALPADPLAAGAAVALAVALLPRLGWIAAALGLVVVLVAAGAPGGAILVLAAALPAAALVRPGRAWSLPAAAPLLGAATLAGAYPALAGRGATVRTRAALGLLGGWWLALAEPLLGRPLLLGAADPAPPGWPAHAGQAAERLVLPAITSGAAAPGLLFALAAAVLPYLVRGRHTGLDVLAAAAWAAALAAGIAAVAEQLGQPEPAGLAAAAIVAMALAVAGARVGPAASSHTQGDGATLVNGRREG